MKNAAVLFLVLAITGACGVNMMPSKDKWYTEHYFIMQNYERDIYRSLTDAGKPEFQKVYWEARPAEVKQEFDKRLSYIAQNFKRENFDQPWNTDRARVYLLNGPPANIEQHVNDEWTTQIKIGAAGFESADGRSGEDVGAATLEVWTYNYKNQFVYYGFVFQPPSKWKQVQISAGAYRYMGELELWSKTVTYGAIDEAKYKQKLEELKAVK
jgi:GWxTD domain-containing protein